MLKTHWIGSLTLLVCAALSSACGPLHMPMVARLDETGQAKVDESWDKAFDPVDRLDHQTLLECLLATQAYQHGVDSLSLRSEKRCSAGLVVMEIHFDREQPEHDQFSVSLYDPAGQIARREVYSREQIEESYHFLFVAANQLKMQRESGTISEEDAHVLADLERRVAAWEKVMPIPEEERSDTFPAFRKLESDPEPTGCQ